MKHNTKLFVDDVRERPDDTWDLAPSFHVAILDLEVFDYDEVSLDHDLASFYGTREMTGRDILNWLIARKIEGKHTPRIVKVHSANPAAWPAMQEDIARYFSENRQKLRTIGVYHMISSGRKKLVGRVILAGR